jgi:hypothetical protein
MPKTVVERRRTVLVDSDQIRRMGYRAALELTPHVEFVADLDHAQAESSTAWQDADVVLVRVDDPAAKYDQFPGVAIAASLMREHAGVPRVIAVCDRVDKLPLLRRLIDANVDLLIDGRELTDPQAIASAISCPERHAHRPNDADFSPLTTFGITSATRVNKLVDYVANALLFDVLGLDSSPSGPLDPRTRRFLLRLRCEAHRLGLEPVTRDGRAPQGQDLPSVSQIRRAVSALAKIDA